MALVCMMALFASAASAQQTDVRSRKFSIHLGFPVSFFGGESFIKESVGMSMGFLATPRNLFMLDLNFGAGPSKQIGTFSYYEYPPNSLTGIERIGSVLYVYDYWDVVFSYNRLFDLSKLWQFYVGPAIGFTSISASKDYDALGYVEGLSYSDNDRLVKKTFTAGVHTGLRLNLFNRGSLDITYLLAGHGKINFEEREIWVSGDRVEIGRKEFGNITHRFKFSVGWRFGKRYKKASN